MSDFLSHLVSSALGTGHPVQPMFAPQAPPPEAVPVPELPPAPLAPPLAPSSELLPPRAPRPAPRGSRVPDPAPVPSPVPEPIPDPMPNRVPDLSVSVPGAEPGRSLQNPDSVMEDEENLPPAEAGREEGRARAAERPVALRHVPLPASPAARERRTIDAEMDSEPMNRRESGAPEIRPSRESVPALPESAGPAENPKREPREFVDAAKRSRREPQEPLRAAQRMDREAQEPMSPAQDPIRNHAEVSKEPQRPLRTEEDSRPARPAFTESASETDRQDAPALARPAPESLRRPDQAQERRRSEREVHAPSAPPPVQIRIGRVEVRAVRPSQPSAPAKAPAPAPAAPTPSLTDYLRKQRGRS